MVQSKRERKLRELLNIVDISEEEVAKSKLGKLVFVSKDKNGNGITYKKSKEVK